MDLDIRLMFVEHQPTSGTKILNKNAGTRALMPDYAGIVITVLIVKIRLTCLVQLPTLTVVSIIS